MNFTEIMQLLLAGFPVSPEFVDPNYPVFLQTVGGLQLTIVVTMISLFFGFLIGIVLALGRAGWPADRGQPPKVLVTVCNIAVRWPAIAITEGFRALPVMLLVLLVYYLPYPLFGVRVPASVLAVVAFSIYSGVYLAEVFRSGFRAIEQGTRDAAFVFGLSRWAILFHIKLPIAVRTMAPSIVGVAITTFKDTSVLSVVATAELTYTARQLFIAKPIDLFLILSLVLVIYWGGASLIAWVVNCLVSALGSSQSVISNQTVEYEG